MSHSSTGAALLPAVRTWRTSLWLWFVLVANVLIGLLVLYVAASEGLSRGADVVAGLVFVAGIDLGRAAGAALILSWRMIGFHIIVGAAGVSLLSAPSVDGNMLRAFFSAFMHSGLIYCVLQYPKENKALGHLAG